MTFKLNLYIFLMTTFMIDIQGDYIKCAGTHWELNNE